jgi:hypothetical protein
VNCNDWLLNVVKWRKYSPVKFENFVFICITRGKIQIYTKFANFSGLYFHFTTIRNQTLQFYSF